MFSLPSSPPHGRKLVLVAVALVVGCGTRTGDELLGQSGQALTVCPTGTVVKGVDVSVFQGTVDWTQAKAAGMDFAIARISDGSLLDTQFATNWTGMASAGLVRGAYQYFEPGQDPMAQATVVIDAVGMLGAGDLPVTADMETTGSQSPATIAANLQTWATAVQAGTGKMPMIYTAEGYWDSDVASSAFANNPLWVANWGVTCPDTPTGWNAWEFWQDSDSGSVAGISGAVDTDQFNGTLAQLEAFAGGMGTVTGTDAGGGPEYAAQYVSQSWPLATTTMMMTPCQTMTASITFKNIGTKAWDTNTRLATTQPRDRVSELADSTWVSTDRLAEVTGTVAPGATFEFKFDFHAPPTAGSFDEFFGLVEDGVAWFSDPGQGGPPDNDIEAKIDVTGAMGTCTVDEGAPDAAPDAPATQGDAAPQDDAAPPPAGDSGQPTTDAAGPMDSGAPVVLDASPAVDGGRAMPPPSDSAPGSQKSSGCSCSLAAKHQSWGNGIGGLALVMAALGRRRRRSLRHP